MGGINNGALMFIFAARIENIFVAYFKTLQTMRDTTYHRIDFLSEPWTGVEGPDINKEWTVP